jgi:hypothetical protein
VGFAAYQGCTFFFCFVYALGEVHVSNRQNHSGYELLESPCKIFVVDLYH